MMLHLHKYESATATIISQRKLSQHNDTQLGDYEWVADVQPKVGDLFRTVIKMPHDLSGDFNLPAVGMTVNVFWNPKDNHVKFDSSDPQISWKAIAKHDKELQRQREAADLNAPPGTPPSR
jgi:hypothetical protein